MTVMEGSKFYVPGYCAKCGMRNLYGFYLYPTVNPHLRKKVIICSSCGKRTEGKYIKFRKNKRKYKMR